ncbi:tight adherence protein G [Mannheimia granulomatis]|uniref:tight adherence protein G n=1 Tax=Mannheimia granulomatis TaxID=85402 RepID=UPI000478DCBF|nr:tight adherence protein G [Mannheimia granulomatis]QLB18792.1 tight adherence protein G [Mannheimia granulomatis]
MKIISLFQTKRFIQDESGVYTIMGGLLALPILALIFVSLEGAAIIQDKARLADSLEQAVLALTAENNSGRKATDYKLSGGNTNNDGFNMHSEVGKRDHQITKTFVKVYLPQTNEEKMQLTPVCTTKHETNKKGHTSSSEVTCTVAGNIDHLSWFPLTVGNITVIPQNVSVASESKAFKKNSFNIPIDLMVVTDLSGSMRYDLTNTREVNNGSSKLGILKSVLEELAAKSLFSPESNDNNRIAVAPFALGAQYSDNQCILPFVLKNDQIYSYRRAYYTSSESMKKSITNYLSGYYRHEIDRIKFAHSLAYLVDIKKTIESIGKEYPKDPIIFNKNKLCLGERNRNSHKWYNKNESSQFFTLVEGLHAEGSTLVSSGLLTAATIMLKEKSRTEELGEQTKRVILVLSDGNDELTAGDKGTPFTQYSRITENFLLGQEEVTQKANNNQDFYDKDRRYVGSLPLYFKDETQRRKLSLNACDQIREKLNQHNRDQNTKIVFVEFGYSSKSRNAWEKCVGKNNYYSANNRESLLNSFKQAIGETDDIGRSIN